MRVAIIDDDIIYSEQIYRLIRAGYSSFDICTFDSGDALFMEDMLHFDIVFLDIELGDMNGIDIAVKLRKLGSKALIFFVTGYAQYISESFKTIPFQYILKPIDEAVFKRELDRAVLSIEYSNRELCIKTLQGMQYVKLKDIVYIERSGRKIEIHTPQELISTYGTIRDILSRVEDHNFVRCHSGYIVNIANIKNIKGNELMMDNGDILPISRKYLSSTREAFLRYKAGIGI